MLQDGVPANVFFCISFFATNLLIYLQGSREQLAIAEFANSLLTIPKILAVNAAKDSTDLVAKLRAYHNTSQTNSEKANFKWYVICTILKTCTYTVIVLTAVYK